MTAAIRFQVQFDASLDPTDARKAEAASSLPTRMGARQIPHVYLLLRRPQGVCFFGPIRGPTRRSRCVNAGTGDAGAPPFSRCDASGRLGFMPNALGLPRRTADRHWAFARAWLAEALAGG